MTVRIDPPGDKSISHRLLLLAGLAEGTSRFRGLLDAEDVRVTAAAMRQLGASIPEDWTGEVTIDGPVRWRAPAAPIECGNSGTTARLLLGTLAGLGLPAVLRGDPSLTRRPMDRVVYPLQAMGARIRYLECYGRLPVELEERRSGSLRSLKHRPRVASAQVKSCLMLAALTAGVGLDVLEPGRSRDHTERLFHAMGAPIVIREGPVADPWIHLEAGGVAGELEPLGMTVPGDFSSAAFLLAAAWLGTGSVELCGVGLNPTRTGLLDVARSMRARYEVETSGSEAGEPVGRVAASPSRLRGFDVDAGQLPGLIDEVPVLAVLAARAEGVSRLRGAAELRAKESDRLSILAANLRQLGVTCREQPDGLDIEGTDQPLRGTVRTAGDHRITMAFGVLGSIPGCDVSVDDPDSVAVSYPDFWRDLSKLSGTATS